MIPFLTQGTFDPWNDDDIIRYKQSGSQRDKVIYNSYYNSRIMLTDKNVYLCSLKLKNNQFRHFYLYAVKRNLFLFVAYYNQFEWVKDICKYDFIGKVLPKLPLLNALSKTTTGQIFDYNDDIMFSNGCIACIKVNANPGDFLFPRNEVIYNSEIRKKFSIMTAIQNNLHKEYEVLNKYIDNYQLMYDAKIQEQKDKFKKTCIKIGVRKVAFSLLPVLVGLPPLGMLDDIFNIDDVNTIVDLGDTVNCALDIDDMDGISTLFDFDESNYDISGGMQDHIVGEHNVSFGYSGELYDRRAADFLKEMDKYGIEIPDSVDHHDSYIDRSYSGGFTSIDKSIIKRSIEDAFKDGDITEAVKKKLIDKLYGA